MEENKDVEVVEEVKEAEGIKISNDVIAVIAEALKGKKNLAKGIKVDATDTTAKIDVNIIVEYGSRIPDVAFEIQNRVKKSVESMTGLKVTEVNVHVQGVNTESLSAESMQEEDIVEENKEDKE